MPDKARIQQYLKAGNFKSLFVEELGWDILRESPLTLLVDEQTFTLRPLVEKRGVKVYECSPNAEGKIPADTILRRIEREVTRLGAYEHILIAVDKTRENQVWQWVKRETGKPLAPRFQRLSKGQSGEALAQKLLNLAVSLEEEPQLSTVLVSGKVQQAFCVGCVWVKFYDRFKLEHAAFLTFIDGITAQTDREWYASLMLNRLMFIYFIQQKGFLDTRRPGALDGDTNYLSNRLKLVQEQRGQDQFHSFYRSFLLKLFHDGLSKKDHTPELKQLLGNVPYLNGGLFDVHILEHDNPKIQIPDEAFGRLFAFFNTYDWHLDDRPLKNDREINPEVLGYIFEKYINQKQMGAYYTKEDITDYISKNTIIPRLFDAAEQKCQIAFVPEGPVWSLLKENPDRYIYEAVSKGCELPYPAEIEAGLQDVSRRSEWNRAAPDEYALPTETWREVVARRTRYQEIRAKLASGEVISINDVVTYNLNIVQLAQDAISYSEGVDLLLAFYESIEQISVLDPTCGSGAFLFAALNILEPLYEACLDRMQLMVEERDQLDKAIDPIKRQNRPGINRFREILKTVADHSSREYFILKSIIINNLYGVDIMEEAVEICKLRLFLKLVAQVQQFTDIEPLPDIDFNIRSGNTLVGFARSKEVRKAVEHDLISAMTSSDALTRIEQQAQEIERGFEHFRQLQNQLNLNASILRESKHDLGGKLHILRNELDHLLASEYGINRSNIPQKEVYEERVKAWQKSHQPFHWFVEFYGILHEGGFDVIIGNPPYVEISDIREQYSLQGLNLVQTGNLYSICLERFVELLSSKGSVGVIVPISSISTPRMLPLMDFMGKHLSLHMSSFAVRPGKLFVGVDMNLTIIVASKRDSQENTSIFSANYRRWNEESRKNLFDTLVYSPSIFRKSVGAYPKLGSQAAVKLHEKVTKYPLFTRILSKTNGETVYYHSGGRYFRKCIRKKISNEYKELSIAQGTAAAVICLLSSSFYYWLWICYSDCYHVTKKDIDMIPVPDTLSDEPQFQILAEKLLTDLEKHAQVRIRTRADGSQREEINYYVGKSKPIIDEIDRVLARHYGFTDEELDFIINYDIKYRMGRDNGEEDEE